jgi:DNA-binding response OmpR family regulator
MKATLLVVDDEDSICKLLERILVQAGYDVVTAANGSEAIEKLSQVNIDLVLLDIMMPGLNGLQVTEAIRQKYDIPVIMLTGKGEVTTVRDALSIGADDYIRKPFTKLELLARIEAKLRRSAPKSFPASPTLSSPQQASS